MFIHFLNNLQYLSIIIYKRHKKNKEIIICSLILTLVMIKKSKDIKICLCAIAKNENKYLREFVEHYKKIGYNKIFLYDNNDIFGEKIEEAINDYIIKEFVKVIYFKEISPNKNPQIEAYKDCYAKNSKLYDWLSFFDIDEYVELNKKYKTMKEFLKDKKLAHCQNIKINWLDYYDNNLLYYENKPLQERIQIFRYDAPVNIHIKSTIKGNLSKNFWENARNPHTSRTNYTSCSSSDKIIKYNSPYNNPPDFTNAKLKHYRYKSFQEYCLKIKRGRADCDDNKRKQLMKKSLKQLHLQIQNNSEKAKIFHKIFNDSIYELKL